MMIELLKFIFSGFWIFFGSLAIIALAGATLVGIFEGIGKIGQSHYYNYIYKKEEDE